MYKYLGIVDRPWPVKMGCFPKHEFAGLFQVFFPCPSLPPLPPYTLCIKQTQKEKNCYLCTCILINK